MRIKCEKKIPPNLKIGETHAWGKTGFSKGSPNPFGLKRRDGSGPLSASAGGGGVEPLKQTLTQCPADSTTFPLLRTLGTCLGAFFQGFLDGACLGDNQRIHRRTPNSGQQERLALLNGWLREGSLPEVMKRAKMALAFCWSSPPGVGGSHGGHKWAKENRAPDHTILYHPPGVTCTLPKKNGGLATLEWKNWTTKWEEN